MVGPGHDPPVASDGARVDQATGRLVRHAEDLVKVPLHGVARMCGLGHERTMLHQGR
jgi:hypothetical protein